jgi:integrase
MAGRRHFGNVRKLPSGRYQASYWHGGRRYGASNTFTAKSDALAWLSKIETDIGMGAWVDPAGGRMTVGELAGRWLAANPAKRANTRATDELVIRVHLESIARHRIGSITQPDVQKLVSSWTLQAAPRSVRRWYSTLRAVFSYAVASDWLARSPCRRIHLPAVTSTRRTNLTTDQVARLAEATDGRYRAMIWLGAVLGWRWEEVAGLRVGALDLLGSTITVAETVIRDSKGAPVMSRPKSQASARTVAAPLVLVEILAEHLAARDLTAADSNRLVFEAPGGGPLRYSNWLRRVWRPAARAAGCDGAGFHDLRRANATHMLANGVDVRTAQARLGHADPRLTLAIYAQAVEEADRRAAETIGAVFLGSPRRNSSGAERRPPENSSRRRLRERSTDQHNVSAGHVSPRPLGAQDRHS